MRHQQFRQPPIDGKRIKAIFQQIDYLVVQLLDAVNKIYNENGLKYFNKPTHDSLMRLLTPYELKVFYDYTDICCLFQNRSHLIQNALLREKSLKKINFQSQAEKWYQAEIDPNLQSDQSDLDKGEKISILQGKYHIQNVQLEGTTENRTEREKDYFNQMTLQRRSNYSSRVQQKEHKVKVKLCQWVEQQISMGKVVTRNDLKRKVRQLGDSQGLKLGERWFKQYIRNALEIRNLLTHGNSNEARKLDMVVKQETIEYSSNNSEFGEHSELDDSSMFGSEEKEEVKEDPPEPHRNRRKYGM